MCKQITNTLDGTSAKFLEAEITSEDIVEAISKLAYHKAPGSDGIPAEFYAAFDTLLAPYLRIIFSASQKLGHLSTSQKHSVIIMLHKKGDKEEIRNYRPISLTNLDYKIFSTILSSRLGQVIHNLINPHQTGFIPGRFIGENNMLLQSILSHYAKHNKSACLIFLDFEKAFDRISHTFMHMMLKEMNFGPKFRNCIKTLYAGASANVRLNHCDSANFGIKSGVRHAYKDAQ